MKKLLHSQAFLVSFVVIVVAGATAGAIFARTNDEPLQPSPVVAPVAYTPYTPGAYTPQPATDMPGMVPVGNGRQLFYCARDGMAWSSSQVAKCSKCGGPLTNIDLPTGPGLYCGNDNMAWPVDVIVKCPKCGGPLTPIN